MKKLVTLMLVLLMVLSTVPTMAFAKEGFKKPGQQQSQQQNPTQGKDNNKGKEDPHKENNKDPHKGDPKKHGKKKAPVNLHDDANHTASGYGCNTVYHWIQYACGCKFNVEPHVDPKETDDDYCICGYHFSSNADLVTLWVDGCPPIKKFNKNTTEYELDAYTYKDVKEIKISTNTFDSEATVELPEDLTLKEGENKFEVKVVAENQKNSKVYTLIINKEAK